METGYYSPRDENAAHGIHHRHFKGKIVPVNSKTLRTYRGTLPAGVEQAGEKGYSWERLKSG
jgi:hypothetical protein